MPDFPAFLTVAYVMSDGSVLHVTPGEQYRLIKYPAGAHVRFGDPKSGFDGWTFQEPFGCDLLVVIASTSPVVVDRGASANSYLLAVEAAAKEILKHSGEVVTALALVEVVPKH